MVWAIRALRVEMVVDGEMSWRVNRLGGGKDGHSTCNTMLCGDSARADWVSEDAVILGLFCPCGGMLGVNNHGRIIVVAMLTARETMA